MSKLLSFTIHESSSQQIDRYSAVYVVQVKVLRTLVQVTQSGVLHAILSTWFFMNGGKKMFAHCAHCTAVHCFYPHFV